MEKDLFLILKTQYFNEIESGQKNSEYRLLTEYWLNRLSSQDWKFVTFQLGYNKDAKRIRKRITGIEIITIEHEFFGGNPVDVFEIKITDI
jgi:hypothetical protein